MFLLKLLFHNEYSSRTQYKKGKSLKLLCPAHILQYNIYHGPSEVGPVIDRSPPLLKRMNLVLILTSVIISVAGRALSTLTLA